MTKPKKSVFIATPCYAGNTTAIYTHSLAQLVSSLTYRKIPWETKISAGEAMIQRARNMHVQEFLNTDFTHMMFIDADQGWEVENFNRLLKASDDYDVVGGLYPIKAYNWKGVVETGSLWSLIQRTWKPLEGSTVASSGFQRATAIPTGFMMINRHVFENLMEALPDQFYYDNAPDRPALEPEIRKTWNFFEPAVSIDRSGKTSNPISYGEDYSFCHRVVDAGMTIAADFTGSDTITHQGVNIFGRFSL